MKLGVIREGKVPPDKRVPFTPTQCAEIIKTYPEVDLVVQPSEIRAYSDQEYIDAGITLQEDLSDCDVLFGVKEVNIEDLIPNKTYFFFSHTYKQQPYNAKLLRAILDKKIRLVDYEVLTNAKGQRLVAFGRYAGIVGAYNGLRGWSLWKEGVELKKAEHCHDRAEMNAQAATFKSSKPLKIVLTGKGRVASGAVETLREAGISEVSPEDFINNNYLETVYTQLDVTDYITRDEPFTKSDFYTDPSGYRSNFMRFAQVADLYIAGHYWDSRSPFVFTREDAKSAHFNLCMVADVSCDIDGPVASTLKPSTIANPFYGYDPESESEVAFGTENSIGVMAVDNLPCELPRDASVDFGRDLIDKVLPSLLGEDSEGIILRASETNLDGELTEAYAYLKEYSEGN